MERSGRSLNGHNQKSSLPVTRTGCHMRSCIRKFTNRRRFDNQDTTESKYESLNFNPFEHSDHVHQKKKAFLCAVSYQKQEFRLKGTINDVQRMRDMLLNTFHFPKESILVLTEFEQAERYIPTKKNIQEAFRWLVKDMQPEDSLVFYYSGHGIRQLDFDDDETDGLNECLCPVDFKENGIILDNEINDTIVRPLVKGVKLHAIVDSCHSGTILDLSHVYDIKRNEWKTDYPPSGAHKGTSGGLAICISACLDSQYAADTDAFSGAKEMTGAMTYTLVDAVHKKPGLTYYDLHNTICKAIEKASDPTQSCNHLLTNVLFFQPRIRQDPQLSASDRFDVHTKKFQL